MLSLDYFHFSSDMPYPPVEAEEKNPAYTRVIPDNVGGTNSGMLTIGLYVYNNLMTESNKEIADVFRRTSIAEMHHLEIFGKLALQLGEDPRMWTQYGCKRTYWSPGYNQYPRELPALVRNAIDSERAAVSKYQHQMSCIRDENITENLCHIIMDERLHVEILEQVYASNCSMHV